MIADLTNTDGTPIPSNNEAWTNRSAVAAWIARGDERAARWLVEEHHGLLAGIVRSRLPREITDDAMQTVWLRFFRSLARYDVSRPLVPWLARIAMNVCNQELRAEQKRNGVFVNGIIDCAAEDSEPRDAELKALLPTLLGSLAETDRQLMWMYHAENLSANQIGAQLGVSAGNVRVRVFRVQCLLRCRANVLFVA